MAVEIYNKWSTGENACRHRRLSGFEKMGVTNTRSVSRKPATIPVVQPGIRPKKYVRAQPEGLH